MNMDGAYGSEIFRDSVIVAASTAVVKCESDPEPRMTISDTGFNIADGERD